MSNSIQIIVNTIRDALDEVPPEIVSDLLDNGVCLAGGGSQILGLVPRLRDELNLRVWIADDPMTCVARGTGVLIDNLNLYAKFIVELDQIHN
jgi:rod shape-determining protein MreB